MSAQPTLFDEPQTIASPFCFYSVECQPKARVALGPEEVGEGYINRELRCLKCGRTGVQSENTTLTRRDAAQTRLSPT